MKFSTSDLCLAFSTPDCKKRFSKANKTPFKYNRISNEFSFLTMYYKMSCVFYIPVPLARGYKTHNEFHNTLYGIKIYLRFFLSYEFKCNEQITTCNNNFQWICWIITRPGYVYFMRWELVRMEQHNLSTERVHFTVIDNHMQQKEHVITRAKQSLVFRTVSYIHECVMILFPDGTVTFRMRRSVCNMLS